MAFQRHLFIDRLSRESEDQWVLILITVLAKTYYDLFKHFAGKLCVPIFIDSSSQSPVRCDNFSNWLIFCYLTRSRGIFERMFYTLISMHDRCSPIMKCTYIALFFFKESQILIAVRNLELNYFNTIILI